MAPRTSRLLVLPLLFGLLGFVPGLLVVEAAAVLPDPGTAIPSTGQGEMQIQKILAVVTIVGFAIQQLLEVLKPVTEWGVGKMGNDENVKALVKKWIMAFAAFGLGLAAAHSTGVGLLELVDPTWKGKWGDLAVTGLVFGAGSEGMNTLLKYFQYVKAMRKQTLEKKHA